MGQFVELGVLLFLAAEPGTLLALMESFQDQEFELKALARAAEMKSSQLQPAALTAWMSLEVALGPSLSLQVELGTLLALAAGLCPLQVQVVGLQISQDLLAELVFWLGSAGKAFLVLKV